MVTQLLIGLGTGLALAWLGLRTRFLSLSGAITVMAVSGLTFAAASWVWGILPLILILSVNLWALYGAPAKRSLGTRYQQGTTRHADQIIARTGWAVIMVLLYALGGHNLGLQAAFVGALAASTADAWASEIGVLSKNEPHNLTRGVRVKAGTPGAISLLGLVAATLGAWLQGLLMLLNTSLRSWIDGVPREAALTMLPLAATLGGLAGCLVDSLLGATAQGIYYCESCDQICEERQHSCGRQAQQIRGWSWLTNDGINLIATLVGAAVSAATLTWLARLQAGW